MKNFLILSAIILIFFSCNRFQNTKTGELSFENDSLFFDTIFTYVGSTTKFIKVYNKNNYPITIDKIMLAGGESSPYRLNIDGVASTTAEDIYLDAKDSIFIFAEVTIDPKKDDLIVDDSIIFLSGENRQRIVLESVGMDVHLISGEIIPSQTWVNDKPYLIYHSVMIDTNEILTIDPGVQIYMHHDSYFMVAGQLVANGNLENPIIWRGDRIDDDYYLNKPGQWKGLAFLPGSHDNYLNYVEVNEGTYGIIVDSTINQTVPTLFVNNSKIQHCSYIGLLGHNTGITVTNTVIADCGFNNVALFSSGTYQFFHCTIQNEYSYSVRNSPAVGIQNFNLDDNQHPVYQGFISALFVNSIIYGNLKNEFVVKAYDTTNSLSFTFRNCLMKLDLESNDTSSTLFQNIIVNKDPKFISSSEFDYHLDVGSPAIGKADFNIDNLNSSILRYDIDGIDRLLDSKTDIGAYEYVPDTQ